MNNPNPNWHRKLSPKDRQAVDAVSKWLRPIPWQWFVTATFSGNIRAETAVGKLRQFADRLERFCRANVCFVAGQESKPSLHGIRVPWHFHILLACHVSIPKEVIEATWLGLAGCRFEGEKAQAIILVTPYHQHLLGAEYCLKAMNTSFGDWHFHRLQHFLPGQSGIVKPNHRNLRSARRARAQAARPPYNVR